MENVKPNLVLKNGAIYTVDKERSWAEAIAITGHQITFVGSSDEIEPDVSANTQVIDLEGKMVLPGFIDAHSHPSHGMDYFGNINLYPLDSLEKYQLEITQFAQRNPDSPAYRGGGWSDSLFPTQGPSKKILDANRT